MTAISTYVKRLVVLDQLIMEERSGTLEEIGSILGIKKRQVAVYLQALQALGKGTHFDAKKKSFIYLPEDKWLVVWPKN